MFTWASVLPCSAGHTALLNLCLLSEGRNNFSLTTKGPPLKHIFPSQNPVLRCESSLKSFLLSLHLLSLFLLSQDLSNMRISSFLQARPYLLSTLLQSNFFKFSKMSPASWEEIHAYEMICGIFCRNMWRELGFHSLCLHRCLWLKRTVNCK